MDGRAALPALPRPGPRRDADLRRVKVDDLGLVAERVAQDAPREALHQDVSFAVLPLDEVPSDLAMGLLWRRPRDVTAPVSASRLDAAGARLGDGGARHVLFRDNDVTGHIDVRSQRFANTDFVSCTGNETSYEMPGGHEVRGVTRMTYQPLDPPPRDLEPFADLGVDGGVRGVAVRELRPHCRQVFAVDGTQGQVEGDAFSILR